jgi:two-component system, OmpR family, KDP operon response regulator KdpE
MDRTFSKPGILAIDDDPTLLRFLEKFLQEDGYDVRTADSGASGLKSLYSFQPDLVILDLMMPGMDGWEVCARIRELADIPIILLTAKTGEDEKLRGFRLGIDDYVTKPFSMAELSARIHAVLNRSGVQQEPRVLVAGPVRVNLKERQVYLRDVPVHLTPTEYRIAVILAQQAGETITSKLLHQEIWGDCSAGSRTALRRYIWLLRQKIEADPSNPVLLVNVRGFGYRFEASKHGDEV